MKPSLLITFVLVMLLVQANQSKAGQAKQDAPTPTPYQTVEKGADYRIWERQTFEKSPDGRIISRKHRFTELASGLYYQDASGNWQESQEKIEAFSGGAIARTGQYQVIFANNLNTAGAIDVQIPDGRNLQSSILGLQYYDSSTGDSVVVGQIQDSEGQLISSNQVLYANSFSGIKADVRYTYRKASFEQDVILRQQPPPPERFGLNPDTTSLEVMTEFINPPDADVDISPGIDDQTVGFGAMTIGRGRAFDLGSAVGSSVKVSMHKQYLFNQGRHILLESVPMRQIRPSLNNLPQQSGVFKSSPVMLANNRTFPSTPASKRADKPMKLAELLAPSKGYVLDYVTVISKGNFTFQADTTYFVNGSYTFSGTTTFEGGAIIKYSNNVNNYPALDLYGNWMFQAGLYRPVVFTSMDDDTVGEQISGSSGTPQIITNSYFLVMDSVTNATVKNIRMSYAQFGVYADTAGPVNVWDSQFIKCQDPVASGISADIQLHNVLFGGCLNAVAFDGVSGCSVRAENISVIATNFLDTNLTAAATIALTNSIVICSPSSFWSGIFQTNACALNPAGPVFQVVGAGNYYLTNGSPFRRAGTPILNSILAYDLQQKTTYPPTVYSSAAFSTPQTFPIVVWRDTNANPDFGYHYDPLDYCFGGSTTTSSLAFAAGTAVGWFELPGSGGPGFGIGLNNNNSAVFTGTASSPCYFVRYSCVQECGNGNWIDKGWLGGVVNVGSYNNPPNPSLLSLTFTKTYHLAGEPSNFRDGQSGQQLQIGAVHSEFLGSFGGYNVIGAYTNCLFNRVNYWQGTSDSQYAGETYRNFYRNCTFYGGSFEYAHWESPPDWQVFMQNSAFDATVLNFDADGSGSTAWLTADYNATNAAVTYGSVMLPGNHNVTPVGGYSWQTSWLGNFYLPSGNSLVDAGNTTADQLRLYHFTTQTNQVKETNSIVDIGYHYVATDNFGNLLDSNGNGTPDYLEDSGGAGAPFTIQLVLPVNGSYYNEPANIPLQATVFNWHYAVTNVTFSRGSTAITAQTSLPWNYAWPLVSSGAYTLSASAKDTSGAIVSTPTLNITVTNLCGN